MGLKWYSVVIDCRDLHAQALAPHITDDRNALIDSLLARGATRINVGQDEPVVTWAVFADPESNEFCVLSARER
jgi:hypothetical protein